MEALAKKLQKRHVRSKERANRRAVAQVIGIGSDVETIGLN